MVVDGVEVRRRSRVLLRPRAGGDVFDRRSPGRAACVEAIEQDLEGNVQLAVSRRRRPGARPRDRGGRFFFSPDEVEPLPARGRRGPRVLVAGIGNVFLGDDGFGVALADRLGRRALPAGVEVVDFGIRGMDLAYALPEYDAAVLLDATPRGRAPGTLYVIEPDLGRARRVPEAHGMDPVKVLALARALGGVPPRTLVLGLRAADPHGRDVGGDRGRAHRARAGRARRAPSALLDELLEDLTEGADMKRTIALLAMVGGVRRRARGAAAGDPALPEDAVDVDAPRPRQGRRGRARRQQHDRPRQPRRLRPRAA